jgi:hypothetical protein
MKLTNNRERLVGGALLLEATVFMLCTYLWGPSHTPRWIAVPYIATCGVSCTLFVIAAVREKRLSSTGQP